MLRRSHNLPSLSLVAAMACLVAGISPGVANGSTLLSFRLANEGTKPVSGVDFTVLPPGAIVPPVVGTDPDGQDLHGSPLTILPDSTGFDADKFSVALGQGPGEQRLRLLFGHRQTVDDDGKVQFEPVLDDQGQTVGLFQPGAILNFALNVDSAAQEALRLVLPSGVSSLTLEALAPEIPKTEPPTDESPPVTPPLNPGPGSNEVPEPASVLLWTALIALGLIRYRTQRRGRGLQLAG